MAKKEEVTFRRGPAKTLPNQSVAGTLLIANDTGDVFVDDSNSKRIQLTDTRLLKRTGDTVTGDLVFAEGARIKLNPPKAGADGANKDYVDRASKISGAASSIKDKNLTPSRVVVSDSDGKIVQGAATAIEVGYLSGATSNIQEQLNNKCPNSDATAKSGGRMSAKDKQKLDSIAENANYIEVDNSLDAASTNPVQNAVITAALSKTATASLATEVTAGLMSGEDKTQLKIAYNHSQTSHAPATAEKNQNAFSQIKVGTSTLSAATETDTVVLKAGQRVTFSVDEDSNTITISVDSQEGTAYTEGSGIRISGAEIINSGVRSVVASTKAGCISIDLDGESKDVPITGLKSAAFCTKQELLNANAPNATEIQGILPPQAGGTGRDLSSFKGHYLKSDGAGPVELMTPSEVLSDIGGFPANQIRIHNSTTNLPEVENGVILITYDE